MSLFGWHQKVLLILTDLYYVHLKLERIMDIFAKLLYTYTNFFYKIFVCLQDFCLSPRLSSVCKTFFCLLDFRLSARLLAFCNRCKTFVCLQEFVCLKTFVCLLSARLCICKRVQNFIKCNKTSKQTNGHVWQTSFFAPWLTTYWFLRHYSLLTVKKEFQSVQIS